MIIENGGQSQETFHGEAQAADQLGMNFTPTLTRTGADTKSPVWVDHGEEHSLRGFKDQTVHT